MLQFWLQDQGWVAYSKCYSLDFKTRGGPSTLNVSLGFKIRGGRSTLNVTVSTSRAGVGVLL